MRAPQTLRSAEQKEAARVLDQGVERTTRGSDQELRLKRATVNPLRGLYPVGH